MPNRLRAIAGVAIAGVTLFGVTLLGATLFGPSQGDESEPRTNLESVVSAPAAPASAPERESANRKPMDLRTAAAAVGNAHQVDERASLRPATARTEPVDGAVLIGVLPTSFIDLAKSTVWDERSTDALERFMLLAFDADGDGVLDDFERITAVRSVRDVVWPSQAAVARPSVELDASVAAAGIGGATSLSRADLLLHHDADETRRLDDRRDAEAAREQEPAGADGFDDELRESIIERFRLDDDGFLAIDEYARFLRHFNSESELADLNLDGHVDHADLRLFLDVASPIPTQS